MGATESKLATPPAGSPESGGGWQADDKKVKFCHLCLKQFGGIPSTNCFLYIIINTIILLLH